MTVDVPKLNIIRGGNGLAVPKDPRLNLEWRREMLKRAGEDLGYRAAVKELYSRDAIFAFNGLFWTYDPRKRPMHHQPFVTYDYEDEMIVELVERIEGGGDVVMDKSRDMGVTWTMLELIQWFWSKAEGGFDFLVGSRKEEYVDKKGDPRTHFERLRYNLYRLPWWIRPRGFDRKRHDNYLKLVNPETGNAITGESNNANFSTQGRYAAVFFDEFPKWEITDEKAWMSAGDATPCRIAVGTPFGAGGQFYLLMMRGGTGIKKLRYLWPRHPEKSAGISCVWPPLNEGDRGRLKEDFKPVEKLTSPWYERECLRRSAAEIAQELDGDYIGSGNPVFDGRAMESLRYYLMVKDCPKKFFRVDLEEGRLLEISEPFDWEGFVVLYEERDDRHRYVLGVDVVEGVEGGDFAFLTVLDRMTKGVVGVYWSRLDEVGLVRVIMAVAELYSHGTGEDQGPWVGIETTGPGLATFDGCVARGMTNLFMTPRYDVVTGQISRKKGWRTDNSGKNELISGVRDWLIERRGALNSLRIVGELMTFVRTKTGKAAAKSGCYDDGVMSFGIALQVDLLAPMDEGLLKEVRVEEARTMQEIVDQGFELSEEGVESLEEKCLRHALAKRVEQEQLGSDVLTDMFGFGEY